MAGHSKWANIKHRKGAQDAKRGKVFTKIIKEISVAVKEGGEDVDSNPRLRTAIQNAKGVNMPRENVERAIKKASGNDAQAYMEVTYEGYGPYGIAIFVECTTDNINRTVADVRAIFNKYDGDLGKNGSLEFLFEKKGVFIIEKNMIPMDLEEFQMGLIDFGLEEFEVHNDMCNVLCDFDKFGVMQDQLANISIDVKSASIERIPNELKELSLDKALKILNVIDKFEENDDVQKVFHNLSITDNIIKELNK
tara:strand:+ start:1274 stop:2026 length:753 start_codon:yes stop_codon:yes gene_type:complete